MRFLTGLQGQLGDGSYKLASWTPKIIVGDDICSSLVSASSASKQDCCLTTSLLSKVCCIVLYCSKVSLCRDDWWEMQCTCECSFLGYQLVEVRCVDPLITFAWPIEIVTLGFFKTYWNYTGLHFHFESVLALIDQWLSQSMPSDWLQACSPGSVDLQFHCRSQLI